MTYLHRRRTVLLGGIVAVAGLGGCDLVATKDAPISTSGILRPIMDEARSLLASYETAVENRADLADTLELLRDNHAAHVETLAKITGQDTDEPAETVEGDLSGDAVATLRQAEADGFGAAVAACVDSTPDFAVLLGEIAACRASHADVLELL